MTVDVTVPRTRRAVIAGAIAGTAAIAATALGRVDPVLAGSDGDVVLGAVNSSTATTGIDNTGPGNTLNVFSQAGWGINVTSYSATKGGVRGYSNNEMTGVFGYSSPHFVLFPPTPPAKTGVHGDGDSAGVSGRSGAGVGVRGESDTGDGVAGSSGGTKKSGVYGNSTVSAGFGVFGGTPRPARPVLSAPGTWASAARAPRDRASMARARR